MQEAERLAGERGWSVARDGDTFRRVVASPLPRDIVEWQPVQVLLQVGGVRLCGGGWRWLAAANATQQPQQALAAKFSPSAGPCACAAGGGHCGVLRRGRHPGCCGRQQRAAQGC